MNCLLDARGWGWGQHTEPGPSCLGQILPTGHLGLAESRGLEKACGNLGESNFILVCGGHAGSFSGGDVGRAAVGLLCTWLGGGEVFQKGAQLGQRPGSGICELVG